MTVDEFKVESTKENPQTRVPKVTVIQTYTQRKLDSFKSVIDIKKKKIPAAATTGFHFVDF